MNLLNLINERVVTDEVVGTVERITVKNKKVKLVVSEEELAVRKQIEKVRNEVISTYKEIKSGQDVSVCTVSDDKTLNNMVLRPQWVKIVPYQTMKEDGSSVKGYYVRSKADNYLYMSVSLGNRKLKQVGEKTFLIFNLTQKATCKNASKDCLKFCYADKAPVCFANVVKARSRNTAASMLGNFAEIMQMVINKAKSEYKHITFRWHESGDIYSKNYFHKIVSVMANNPGIRFGIYTKAMFVLDAKIQLPNASIRYSLDMSTPGEIVQKVRENKYPTFMAIQKDLINELSIKRYNICMDDCTHCRKCYIPHENLLDMICAIH